ncbi:GNAT family N-acetyltransferase [Massilia sp. TW-1]|uniref:GNAT family N-acetyltransferase n=1 Tax=Telluria antibiotica TaxID=2717319 RepID=A0ABX0PAL8_9BURK|nr:GNAT family N-acetyltransferase [Telluria antibiotica]NIA54353.1 GNAT family N-acetyltransferase [Telluria antibiotica]
MARDDLAGVLAVQAACYPPAMQEPAHVVLARLAASPRTVLVARDDAGVCAYLFAYPSRLGRVTPLGAPFAVAAEPDTLYLHDVAVAPRAAGQGVARRLVARLHDDAAVRGLRHAALVSVQDSLEFWESLGYAPAAGDHAALATYPGAAHYMTKRL